VERFASQAEKLRSAEQAAERRVSENPSDPKALLDRGLARLRRGSVDAAISDFRHAALLAPSLAEAEADLAYALWTQGRLEEALNAARNALKLDPESPSAHRYAGRLLLLLDRNRNEAVAHLEHAVQLDPQETEAHFDLALAYRAAHDLPNAWAQVRLLETEFPEDDSRLLYVQGRLASDQGRSAVAVEFFRRAWKNNPSLLEAREALGIELARLQRWGEALDLLGAASSANPQSFRVTYAYALALMNTGHLAEAEQVTRRVMGLNQRSEVRALLDQITARRLLAGERKP
jgi:Flp pilus assembly protein TadD